MAESPGCGTLRRPRLVRPAGCGPLLRTGLAGPICAEHPASAETLGNWDCPEFPRKPDLPR
jgi:hypothetical protein